MHKLMRSIFSAFPRKNISIVICIYYVAYVELLRFEIDQTSSFINRD